MSAERTFKSRDMYSNDEITVEVYPDGSVRIFSESTDSVDLSDTEGERLRQFLNGKDV